MQIPWSQVTITNRELYPRTKSTEETKNNTEINKKRKKKKKETKEGKKVPNQGRFRRKSPIIDE